jgi:G3E family GTPase
MISADIISGFLGAGKTTFINRFCKSLHNLGETVVIIENEYGKESIDSELLSETGNSIIDLSQGCICCNLKNGLEDALMQIAEQIKPDRIIIEPSGIFILSEIFGIFNTPEIRQNYEISSIITLVDAQLFLRCKGKYGMFIENQIKYSSQLILTKHKALPKSQIEEIITEIKTIKPDADICLESIFELNDEQIIELAQSHPVVEPDEYIKAEHSAIKSITLYPKRLCSIRELERILSDVKSGSFGDIIRLKGFIKSSMNEAESFKLQYVGGKHTITSTTKQLRPMLNIIGEKLNKAALTEIFEKNQL